MGERHALVSRAARLVGAAGLVAAGALALVAGPAGAQQHEGEGRVLVTTVADPITPVIADHLGDAVERAADRGYEALIVRLDTPGGLDTSMREIVQHFFAADVPVVVHVAPSGARAASAGAIITFAAHVAAMAPATAIGAATPVNLEGGDASEKAREDARAFAESVAEERGRNVEFAIATVDESRSASASEALEIGAVDFVVRSTADLLAAIDGRTVELADGPVTLATRDAPLDTYDMSTFRRILQWLADPNLVFLFMSIGTLAIIYELASPGIGVGGVIGLTMLLLALFALSVLPVETAGLLFLLAAAGLFLAEVFAPGIGVFAVLGTIMLAFAGLFLFDDDTPGMSVSLAAVLPTAIVVGLAVLLAGRFVVRARRRPARAPYDLVGRETVVHRVGRDTAQVQADGVWWSARSSGAPLRAGQHVRVAAVEGLDLVVEPIESEDAGERRPEGEDNHE